MKPVLLLASVLALFVLNAEAQTPAKPKKTTATTTTTTTTTTTKPAASVSNKANNAINGANNAVNGANNAVNVANNKMNSAASSVNGTYNSVNNTKNKITGFLNKGNDTTTNAQAALPPPPPGPPGKPTDTLMQNLKKIGNLFKKPRINVVVKVPGANRAKLKELTELLKTCPNVDKKNVDFDDAQQSITVNSYKGKLPDLLSDIQKRNAQVTNSNSTASAADNSITINL
jgi:hypothetical protein